MNPSSHACTPTASAMARWATSTVPNINPAERIRGRSSAAPAAGSITVQKYAREPLVHRRAQTELRQRLLHQSAKASLGVLRVELVGLHRD